MSNDRLYLNARQLAPVTNCPMVAFPPLVLVSDNFFILELSDDLASNIGSGDDRITRCDCVAIGEKNDIAEGNFVAGSRIEFLDRNSLSRANPILLASRTNDRVRHAQNPSFGKAQKLPQRMGNDN